MTESETHRNTEETLISLFSAPAGFPDRSPAVPWQVGMAVDHRPVCWHAVLAEPFSGCPSGQWKVQVDP